MKTKLLLIVIFFIFLFCNRSYSQTKVIDFPRFNSKVVSFSIEYQDRILESLKNRFTPDSSSIYEIEKYLFDNNIANSGCKKRNYRQYIGFKKNDKPYILVKILDFKNEKKIAKFFPEWQYTFAFILTDLENYPNLPEYYYDLELKYLDKFEWGKNDED
jgi:hypothetical protein